MANLGSKTEKVIARPLLRGSRSSVSCGHPLAVQAAVGVLDRGGNAVDGSVAAALALCVLLPDACGLGGDSLFMVREADGSLGAFNGSGAAPEGILSVSASTGGATAAVPGALAAWEDAHRRYGTMPWQELLAPAIRLARDGFPLSAALASSIDRHREHLTRHAPSWKLLDPVLRPGMLVRQPELAAVLERIAAEGSRAFYDGVVAQAVGAAAGEDGGALGPSDLAAHTTVERLPVEGSYRGARLVAQPPVSQAILALMTLAALERSGASGPLARRHAAIEGIEAAFAHRDEVSAPDAERRLLDVPLEIDPERALGRGGPILPTHTTSVAVCDAEATIVSMLLSVFDEFGSGRLVPEHGFILNSRLTGFTADPGSSNAIAPGQRPVHTLSPMIIEDGGGRVYALATPGADGQVQTLTQIIDAVVGEGEGLSPALHQPRWRSANGQLLLEGSFNPELAKGLARLGHDVAWWPSASFPFGAAVIAGIDLEAGTLFAASDPRRETWAAVT